MRITVLAENTTDYSLLKPEHGLSLFIETKNHNILFDTGQSELFYENAEKLKIDLKSVDIAILSHGHYDHSGGISKFIEINDTAPIYVNRRVFEPYFNASDKYIGVDPDLRDSDRMRLIDDEFIIDNSLSLYTCNELEREFDLGSFGLSVMKDSVLCPDDFLHEQYLLIEENDTRILISGCSHKGILNIEKWFTPDILVGGFHFSKLELDEKLEKYAQYLSGFDTDYYTCHCTGVEQYEYMRKFMPRLNYISTGTVLEI